MRDMRSRKAKMEREKNDLKRMVVQKIGRSFDLGITSISATDSL